MTFATSPTLCFPLLAPACIRMALGLALPDGHLHGSRAALAEVLLRHRQQIEESAAQPTQKRKCAPTDRRVEGLGFRA